MSVRFVVLPVALLACSAGLAPRGAQAAQRPDAVYGDGFECRTWYPDNDHDGFGIDSGATLACARPPGFAFRSGDCDDGNATINPGAADVPDDAFTDSDCDGIDGASADGVFVASDGNDVAAGTAAAPLKTIGAAQAAAVASGRRFVFIATGSYAEVVAIDATNQGIGLHGGYVRASNWQRNGTQATVSGPRSGALRVDATTQATTVEYLHFSGAAAATPGASAYAIVVNGATGLQLRHLKATAGNAADGGQGANAGAAGDDGGDGNVGAAGYEDDAYFYCAGDLPDPALATPGGASCTGAPSSTKGGDGHRGCKTNSSACAGNAGDPGSPNPDGVAGDGGTGVVGGAGNSGQPGLNGQDGGDGDGGADGSISAGEWVGEPGANGNDGSAGTGGGGGAGGGSNHSSGTCNDWGGSGGGGGGGGCGGGGGDGGSSGGASIAILLVDSSVTATQVLVQTGAGGNGGAGRDGGAPGPGGLGRGGGPGYDEGLAGGAGASGGAGGRGGHGGGGAGGWVVGVYRSNSTWSDAGSTSAMLGTPGAGGASSGNGGTAGSAYSIF